MNWNGGRAKDKQRAWLSKKHSSAGAVTSRRNASGGSRKSRKRERRLGCPEDGLLPHRLLAHRMMHLISKHGVGGWRHFTAGAGRVGDRYLQSMNISTYPKLHSYLQSRSPIHSSAYFQLSIHPVRNFKSCIRCIVIVVMNLAPSQHQPSIRDTSVEKRLTV